MKKLLIVASIVLMSLNLGCNKKKLIHEDVEQTPPAAAPENEGVVSQPSASTPLSVVVGDQESYLDGVIKVKVDRKANRATQSLTVTSSDGSVIKIDATTLDCRNFGKYTFQQKSDLAVKVLVDLFDGSLNLQYWPNRVNCQLQMNVDSSDGRQVAVDQAVSLEFDVTSDEVVSIQSLKEESYQRLDGIGLTFERHDFVNPAQFPVRYDFIPRGPARAASVMFYDHQGTDHNCVFLQEYAMTMDNMEVTINGETKQIGVQNYSFTLQPGEKARIDLIVHTPGTQPTSGANYPNVRCPGAEPICRDVVIPTIHGTQIIQKVCEPLPTPIVSLWGFTVLSVGQKSTVVRYYGDDGETVTPAGGGGSMPGASGWGSQRCM